VKGEPMYEIALMFHNQVKKDTLERLVKKIRSKSKNYN